jgi:hypothetical protein
MSKIEKFISNFRKHDEKLLVKMFTEDYCYHFSVILKAVFPRGDIYYDVIHGHFILEFDERFYDITGVVEPHNILVPFDQLEFYDELVYGRVVKDCVLKESNRDD